jgi:hypothetical protein
MSALKRSPFSGQYLTVCSGFKAELIERTADWAWGSFATWTAKFFNWTSVTGWFVNPWVIVVSAETVSAWDDLGFCGIVAWHPQRQMVNNNSKKLSLTP